MIRKEICDRINLEDKEPLMLAHILINTANKYNEE